MSFEEQISAAIDIQENCEQSILVKALVEGSASAYVIGKNDQSLEIINRYNVRGLIDDYNVEVEYWNGVPVVQTKDVDLSSIVINCVTSISPVLVRNSLRKAGLSNLVEVSELIAGKGDLVSLPWFVEEQREEWKQNKEWWLSLNSLLSDQTSKQTLADVLRFRLTANPDYMNAYIVRLRDQYFEDFMQYKSEVFVDAGGFDGDTTEEFINRYPDYKKVYLFEPSLKNLDAAKNRLQGRRNIDFRALGLSNREGTLFFNADAGSASAITNSDGESISVVALDKVLENEPISFIKMDLEGWEIHALRGAEMTIKKNKPKLAIAVYHAAKDFREIPQYILNINPDYKIFLRHYTQGWSETVMFFL
jgi:FkbM family methyltransferase